MLSEVIYYDSTEHDNISLHEFIKDTTKFHPYAFIVIDVEAGKFTGLAIQKKDKA